VLHVLKERNRDHMKLIHCGFPPYPTYSCNQKVIYFNAARKIGFFVDLLKDNSTDKDIKLGE
jgi:hypothetical protein